jgi:SAM-dependent methyltransferase
MPAQPPQAKISFFLKLVNFLYDFFWYCYPFSLERIISRELNDYQDICDLGCGDGGFAWRLKHFKKNIPSKISGCDIYAPYILASKERNVFHNLVRCDARNLPFKDNSFDVMMVIMVIEHLEKDLGFIRKFEKMARDKVIITTSNGYSYNPEEGVIHQRHLSGYSIEDFKKLGYRVRGMGGSRFLCGDLYKEYKIPLIFRPIFSFAYLFFTVFTYYRPELADHLICVKYKEGNKYAN